jgi:hypothetical protein
MRPSWALRCAAIAVVSTLASAQASTPAYSGVWKLDLKRSRIEAKHPPSSSTATIRYDGRTWNFSRTHHYPHKPAGTWTTSMVVDASEPQITHDPPFTITARITREGDQIVLREDYVADTGEKATNTVHYRLEDGAIRSLKMNRRSPPKGTSTICGSWPALENSRSNRLSGSNSLRNWAGLSSTGSE